ncbi:MAG: NAD(+) kinase [Gammaproteobacteria bacterium]
MATRFKTIALMGKLQDARVTDTVVAISAHLLAQGAQVLIGESERIDGLPTAVEREPDAALAGRAQLIIAIGGDGSMLHAARQAALAGIPLLGVNRGRLGFLADMPPSDRHESLDRVLAGEFESDERLLLKAEIVADGAIRDCGLALNDVVVKRHDTGRMLEYRSYVDGRFVNQHGGDGFIVATPTGSTAYALSCGGPIVAPFLDAIVLAPICPHTLSDRPIVIPGDSMTEVRVGDDPADRAEVSCDGEVAGTIDAGDTLRVCVAPQRLKLIHPTGYDYYEILRSKLHWGRSNRKQSTSG